MGVGVGEGEGEAEGEGEGEKRMQPHSKPLSGHPTSNSTGQPSWQPLQLYQRKESKWKEFYIREKYILPSPSVIDTN